MRVQIIVNLDGLIPAATKLDIAEQAADKLRDLDFGYSELPDINEVDEYMKLNKEPISSTLETFKDMDEAIGRASKEQGGNRINQFDNTERDPLNE